MKEKYWADCSKEEKSEVNAIERQRKALKKQFLSGEISNHEYSRKITELMKRLDEVERKYDQSTES